MIKYIIPIILSLLIVMIQQSMLSGFDYVSLINIALITVVYIRLTFDLNLALYYALFLGIATSMYSYMPFGTHILAFFAILAIAHFLHTNVFTNYSLVSSIIITLVCSISYAIIIPLLGYLYYGFNITTLYISANAIYAFSALYQSIVNIAAMAFLFIITKIISKRFDRVFLTQ